MGRKSKKNKEFRKWRKTESQRDTLVMVENLKDAEKG